MAASVQEGHSENSYFFKEIQNDPNANLAILDEIDRLRKTVSKQRRTCRDQNTNIDILNILLSDQNPDTLFSNLEKELKQLKDKAKQLKQKVTQKKDEKRKHRKNSEKLIAEILEIEQQIEHKRSDSVRFDSEYNALQNKHQKQINDLNQSNKYNVAQLIDEHSCQQILAEQESILKEFDTAYDEQQSNLSQQRTLNQQLANKLDTLSKRTETYHQIASIQNHDDLSTLEKQFESLKRLHSLKRLDCVSNKLFIEFESSSKEIYFIQIETELLNAMSNPYSIESVQITNNNTNFNEISEFILTKYNELNLSKQCLMRSQSVVRFKALVDEILFILSKLPSRYRDIRKLCSVYGSNENHDMLPWLPENSQLVFKFSFKQNVVCSELNEKDDDDRKINGCEENNVSILMDIPLVISVAWHYPQCAFVKDDGVITIEHYNCSLRQKYHGVNVTDIETKWNDQLTAIVEQSKGRYQNDIVSFVNFIADRLQHFADSNQ